MLSAAELSMSQGQGRDKDLHAMDQDRDKVQVWSKSLKQITVLEFYSVWIAGRIMYLYLAK